MAVNELNTKEFNAFISSNDYAVVDFFAVWCYPCKMFAPILDKAAEQHKGIVFAKVNVDKCSEIASEFNIDAIPTVVLFKNGKEHSRFMGLKQSDELNDILLELSK